MDLNSGWEMVYTIHCAILIIQFAASLVSHCTRKYTAEISVGQDRSKLWSEHHHSVLVRVRFERAGSRTQFNFSAGQSFRMRQHLGLIVMRHGQSARRLVPRLTVDLERNIFVGQPRDFNFAALGDFDSTRRACLDLTLFIGT